MELIIFSVKVIHIVVSVLLIIVVLLQPGKSGDLGSIFGGGTSDSVFGSAGAVPFLAKVTRGLAVLFMLTSLTLGYFAASGVSKSVVKDVDAAPVPVEESIPLQDAPVGAATDESAPAPENATDTGAVEDSAAGEAIDSPGDESGTDAGASQEEVGEGPPGDNTN